MDGLTRFGKVLIKLKGSGGRMSHILKYSLKTRSLEAIDISVLADISVYKMCWIIFKTTRATLFK